MRNQPDTEKPYTVEPDTVEPHTVFPTQYNIKESNINNLIDKEDKKDKTSVEIKHNILTLELLKLHYIEEDDYSSFYFDSLFEKYLENGYKYRELYQAIYYIVPRVISRNFIDEDGNDIINKYGYFKSSIELNFEKLNNYSKNIEEADSKGLWDDFEL